MACTKKVPVWMVDISYWLKAGDVNLPNDLNIVLTSEELDRATNLRLGSDKQRSLLSCYFLKILVSNITSALVSDVFIVREGTKKPFCIINGYAGPHFSVTHSGDFIGYALAGFPVGIDIEERKPFLGIDDLVTNHFSQTETNWFFNLESRDRLDMFYHLWTAKEAIIKASSSDFSKGLRQFSVISDTGCIDEWMFSSIDAPKGYNAALSWSILSQSLDTHGGGCFQSQLRRPEFINARAN